MHTEFWSEILRGREHSEDLGIDGKMDLNKTGWEGMDWIHLYQDKDQWWSLVNMLMNLWIL
jgi:hypothetical protein